MMFEGLAIEGVHLIRPDRHDDSRGSFSRVYCAEEFAKHGLELLGPPLAYPKSA